VKLYIGDWHSRAGRRQFVRLVAKRQEFAQDSRGAVPGMGQAWLIELHEESGSKPTQCLARASITRNSPPCTSILMKDINCITSKPR